MTSLLYSPWFDGVCFHQQMFAVVSTPAYEDLFQLQSKINWPERNAGILIKYIFLVKSC